MSTKENLQDYKFQSHYQSVLGLNIHYLDEGSSQGPCLMLLHGVPTWSYIYRHMIPLLVKQGYRVIAPDLIGFGKSEKLPTKNAHSYEYHIDWLTALVKTLDLGPIVIYGQDWGAILALHLAADLQDQIRGLVLSNGVILTGEEKLPFMLKLWMILARYSPVLPIGRFIDLGCKRKLSRAEKYAYNSVFKNTHEKGGVRALPGFIPTNTRQLEAKIGWEAWEKLVKYEKPVLCLFSTDDPFTRQSEEYIINRIPGAHNQPHQKIPGGHFIQEDAPDVLVSQIIKFMADIPE